MSKIVSLTHFSPLPANFFTLPNGLIIEIENRQDSVTPVKEEWKRTYQYPAGVLAVGQFGSRLGGILGSLSDALSAGFHNTKNAISYRMLQRSERKARAQLGLKGETISQYKSRLIAQRASLETELKVQWHQQNPGNTGHGAYAQPVLTGKSEYASLSRDEIVAKIDAVSTELNAVYVATRNIKY
jgi:hypothetical protein